MIKKPAQFILILFMILLITCTGHDGKLEIKASFQTLSDTGFVLTWEPLDAMLARSWDLGYT